MNVVVFCNSEQMHIAHSLEELFRNGWVIHLGGLRPIESAPIAEEKIAELQAACDGRVTHVALLFHPERNARYCYAIHTEDELQAAQVALAKSHKITEHSARVVCRIRCTEGDLPVRQMVEHLIDVYGYAASEQSPTEFIVDVRGSTESECESEIERLDATLVAVSIASKVALMIVSLSRSKAFYAQAFHMYAFKPPEEIKIPSPAQVATITRLREKHGESLLRDMRDFYSQVGVRAKLITGASIIAELFTSGREHMLSEEERKTVKRALRAVKYEGDKDEQKRKRDRLLSALGEPKHFAKTTQNEQIAKAISMLLDMDYDNTYDRVRRLNNQRGAAAHSTDEDYRECLEHIAFIDTVLTAYLQR